jgi:hypothetical protein
MTRDEKLIALHQITCEEMGENFVETLKRCRKRKLVECRQATMYIATLRKDLFQASLSEIGMIFESVYNRRGYDHTTVLNGYKTIKNILPAYFKNGLPVKETIDKIMKKYIERFVCDPDLDKYKYLESLIDPLIHTARWNWDSIKIEKVNGVFTMIFRKEYSKGGPRGVQHYHKIYEVPIEDIDGIIKYIETNNRLPSKIYI